MFSNYRAPYYEGNQHEKTHTIRLRVTAEEKAWLEAQVAEASTWPRRHTVSSAIRNLLSEWHAGAINPFHR